MRFALISKNHAVLGFVDRGHCTVTTKLTSVNISIFKSHGSFRLTSRSCDEDSIIIIIVCWLLLGVGNYLSYVRTATDEGLGMSDVMSIKVMRAFCSRRGIVYKWSCGSTSWNTMSRSWSRLALFHNSNQRRSPDQVRVWEWVKSCRFKSWKRSVEMFQSRRGIVYSMIMRCLRQSEHVSLNLNWRSWSTWDRLGLIHNRNHR